MYTMTVFSYIIYYIYIYVHIYVYINSTYIILVHFMCSVCNSAQCYCKAVISILINDRQINYKYIIATNY